MANVNKPREPLYWDLVQQVPAVTANEMQRALAVWIRAEQAEAYPKEKKALLKHNNLPTNSSIRQLTPFLDYCQIMRSKGRGANADIEYDQKHPIILPRQCALVYRLIQEAHDETLHGGAQLMQQYLRDKYWIPRVQTAIRRYVHACVVCARHRAKPCEQQMSDLPASRVEISKVFERTGVDHAGPFRVKAWDTRGAPVTKLAYLAIFVCMLTKACHLEPVEDMSSQAFLAALDRFIIRRRRRRRPSHMYSDNGMTFVGANKVMQVNAGTWNVQNSDTHKTIEAMGIHWHFNVPTASSHGGLWESAIKSVRFHLRRVMGRQVYTFAGLATIFARIEGVLNSRPMTVLRQDPAELNALTPGHFLIGEQPRTVLGPNVREVRENRLDLYERMHKIVQQFDQRLKDSWFKLLRKRTRWVDPQRNLEIDDLVFMIDENLPPGTWAVGRVIKTYISKKDQKVRSVRVRTTRGEYDRPIFKLCLLPLESTPRAIIMDHIGKKPQKRKRPQDRVIRRAETATADSGRCSSSQSEHVWRRRRQRQIQQSNSRTRVRLTAITAPTAVLRSPTVLAPAMTVPSRLRLSSQRLTITPASSTPPIRQSS